MAGWAPTLHHRHHCNLSIWGPEVQQCSNHMALAHLCEKNLSSTLASSWDRKCGVWALGFFLGGIVGMWVLWIFGYCGYVDIVGMWVLCACGYCRYVNMWVFQVQGKDFIVSLPRDQKFWNLVNTLGDRVYRKEAIAHFFRFFLWLLRIFAKFSRYISLYVLFLKNGSMNHIEIWPQALPDYVVRINSSDKKKWFMMDEIIGGLWLSTTVRKHHFVITQVGLAK